jgi:bifunctional DNA-binding transcriptional regulator/antitoxin component of YhaV-PrlF toxin-antitoxin module
VKKIKTGETIGIKRHFDDLGRIVVPKEFRKELGINDDTEGEMFLLPDGIFIKINKEG